MDPAEILETAKQLPAIIAEKMEGVPPAVILKTIAEEMQKLVETMQELT
ncbi:hypothetical protein SAMN02745885_01641 [Carboxydocella sporoproducens DSM 16521]|uniref:Uncharacterized protein n=2 Tax=Carboxydocella TaxID=178898 RepID=A0A1T4QEI5_9FIRM|nr:MULTISPECIES: hypothetical protein [Carboxydocella]AVX21610.1 hypothetical protein CFE_2467 [Carboxydocella thermautotrophica]AVX31816.1 hypothetical protein CTH_2273 [Carboxydocella thermautotrophica]SKA02220.1 hypothetical protein SAMN02745885_01641 [Carboxydocella sporoproducens DSM 16521]